MAIITVGVGKDFSGIQAAINAAQDGDTILVSPGTYNEPLTITGKAITIASEFYTTGDLSLIDQTIIDGGGSFQDADPDVVRFAESASGSQLIGFTVQNGGDGIKVEALNINVLNNRITNTIDAVNFKSATSGVVTGGIVRDNVIENNIDDGVDINRASDVIVEDNIIQNNGNDGIEVRMDGSYAGSTTLNNIFRNNVISFNSGDGIQLIDSADVSNRYYRIEGNLIEGNGDAGLGLMDNGDSTEDFRAASIPEPIDVIGNTFIGNDHGLSGGDNLVAINNIFVNHINIAMKGVNGDSIAAYNLFWNSGIDTQDSNVDATNTIYADPLLDADRELQDGSPAVDAGTAFFEWRGATVLDLSSSDFSGSSPDFGEFESDFSPFPSADL